MSEFNFNAMPRGDHRDPFKVPQGYFDRFAEDFMTTLPDRNTVASHSWWHKYHYIVASAACFIGIVLISTLYVGHFRQEKASAVAEQHIIDASIDEMADYAMYDNGDMYASLSEY